MTSGFYNYIKLIANDTPYGRRMLRLSNHIFGNVIRPVRNRHLKVGSILGGLPHDKNDAVVNYYPRHVETHFLMKHLREYGLFRDEHQDFREEMIRLRALRGKVKPAKGEGKRSKKPK